MPDLTPLDIASIERDAAWFWIDAMLFCNRRGIAFDENHIQARLTHLREHDPADTTHLVDPIMTPEQWDYETPIRYPYIEAAAKEIVAKMAQQS